MDQKEQQKAMYEAAAKGPEAVKARFGEHAVDSPEHKAAQEQMAKAKRTGAARRAEIRKTDHEAQEAKRTAKASAKSAKPASRKDQIAAAKAERAAKDARSKEQSRAR